MNEIAEEKQFYKTLMHINTSKNLAFKTLLSVLKEKYPEIKKYEFGLISLGENYLIDHLKFISELSKENSTSFIIRRLHELRELNVVNSYYFCMFCADNFEETDKFITTNLDSKELTKILGYTDLSIAGLFFAYMQRKSNNLHPLFINAGIEINIILNRIKSLHYDAIQKSKIGLDLNKIYKSIIDDKIYPTKKEEKRIWKGTVFEFGLMVKDEYDQSKEEYKNFEFALRFFCNKFVQENGNKLLPKSVRESLRQKGVTVS